jgi:hypothetical protein
MKLEFYQPNLEKSSISDFMKIRPVGAELFHADGQTRQSNFAKAPTK